jgi:serine/threonine-protein kinase RsbW
MSAEASRNFPAELEQLALMRKFVEETATAWQADPDELADVVLAVDELATNSTLHGYRGRSGDIELKMRRTGADLEIVLRDRATAFDPTQVPPPDMSLPLEDRPIGGLGLHLVRHMVDELRYRARPEGGNEIVLVKKRVFPAKA